MKKTFLFVILLCISMATSAQPLEKWNEGSPLSRPCTWWHWMDCNITRQGITSDLEAMSRAGYHEAQIFNVGYGYPEGSAKYLSHEWLELFKWAATEAKRLGMELCFHNGPGWSSSGGFWVKPEQSMQRVVWTETTLKGSGKKQTILLKQPKAERNWYKDIIVLAFPRPASDRKIRDFVLKSLGSNNFPNLLMPQPEVVEQGDIIKLVDIKDLTKQMDAEGNLTWDAPAGDWTILRMGHTTTGKESHPTSAATGGGLEVDKLSRKALNQYWKDGVQPILDYLGPLVGTALTNCLVDSYEVGCGNWTDGFAQEFQRLRGYDPMMYFPTLAGYYVGSSEQSERFLWDLRKTVNDLMAANYYDRFSELCHQNGLKYSVEPYTGPFNDMEIGASADIVMGEFWMGNTVMPSSPKMAASIAHINGNAVVGAESFTAADPYAGWDGSPAKMKALGDKAWADGINHYIFHTFVHQPNDNGPGYTLGQFGSHFNRLNTLWDAAIPYMKYVTRSQYLLQQGRFVGDVLVYVGEVAPNDGSHRADIKDLGYDYDEIWTDQVAQLQVRNGRLITRSGGEYRVLTLFDTTWMTPQTLRILRRLALQGATIIGKRPQKSPSLEGYPTCDDEVEQLASELWDKGLIRDMRVPEALQKLDVRPDFNPGTTGSDLRFIHRSCPEGEIYFVANPEKQHRVETCEFRVQGLVPQRWDAQTGQIATLPYRRGDYGTVISLHFEPEQSAFIIFRPSSQVGDACIAEASTSLDDSSVVPVSNLKITKAEYGAFLVKGVSDVTDIVSDKIRDNRLTLRSDNGTMGGDPCFGQVKTLVIHYTFDGKERVASCPENSRIQIPEAHEKGELKVTRAFYGAIASNFDSERPKKPVDVVENLQKRVTEGQYVISVNDDLAGSSVAGENKMLRLTYETDGMIIERDIQAGGEVDFTSHADDATLTLQDGQLVWTTPKSGTETVSTASGQVYSARVKSVPQPLTLTGSWDVAFQSGRQAPEKAVFDSLYSYTESTDPSIRYFAGTAVYIKRFTLPKKYLQQDTELLLNLGIVGVIAEARLNGHSLGTAWKAPYRLAIGDAAKAGENLLEVTVSNPWVNRLIGDEQPGAEKLGTASWKHWKADSPLQPAGLIGPVTIQPLVRKNLKLKK
ncbi:MAG: hypothetical protein J5661_07260 [Bacteroidaceae bacterium]|nr:hypothetical protein [Bacteroidaceae bacterium]